MPALLTKNQAAKQLGMLVKDLNHAKIRYDLGKYDLAAKHSNHDRADKIIWYEQRKDQSGPYIVLYTVNYVNIKKQEKKL